MKKILFVCSGNTCRSPLAEGIARKFLSKRTPVSTEISSAGASALEGKPASQHAVTVAAARGVDLSKHRARLLNSSMVREADLIVAMGSKHKETVGVIDPEAAAYTVLMTHFCDIVGDVPDPIGGTREEYERIYDVIELCVEAMAEHLEGYGGWKTGSESDGENTRESP